MSRKTTKFFLNCLFIGLMTSSLGFASDDKPLTIETPCPNKPNCVSSFAQKTDKEHYIEPIKVSGIADFEKLGKIIPEEMSRAELISSDKNVMHFKFTSLIFRFVDDVFLAFDTEKNLINVRSSSRVGYSDLGANRDRIEDIRALLKK